MDLADCEQRARLPSRPAERLVVSGLGEKELGDSPRVLPASPYGLGSAGGDLTAGADPSVGAAPRWSHFSNGQEGPFFNQNGQEGPFFNQP